MRPSRLALRTSTHQCLRLEIWICVLAGAEVLDQLAPGEAIVERWASWKSPDVTSGVGADCEPPRRQHEMSRWNTSKM